MFEVRLSNRAEKRLSRLPSHYKQNVIELLTILQENAVPAESHDVVKVKGFVDTFRVRIGDVRVIYQVLWKEAKVRIAVIEFREGAYE